jgi:hypothetical protein
MDRINYKQERWIIKAHPELESEVTSKLQKYISKQLEWVSFNHQTSQKEDFIMD